MEEDPSARDFPKCSVFRLERTGVKVDNIFLPSKNVVSVTCIWKICHVHANAKVNRS